MADPFESMLAKLQYLPVQEALELARVVGAVGPHRGNVLVSVQAGVLKPIRLRQWQALYLASLDYNGPAAAPLVGVTHETLRKHHKQLFEALVVGSMAGAVGKAFRLGVLA